ncbi:17796_t:CDS:2 [Entrophospora sp. SA101]|nr:17796_t:CDS:2 [Entrophospora sp. SA101]
MLHVLQQTEQYVVVNINATLNMIAKCNIMIRKYLTIILGVDGIQVARRNPVGGTG